MPEHRTGCLALRIHSNTRPMQGGHRLNQPVPRGILPMERPSLWQRLFGRGR